jgi:NAD(P)-dependent dehydrogenase (short-subunit alcohol dehydrogenase family)
MGRLDGKRAIVTGAASGIGRASALRFAEEGATVVVADVAEAGIAETAAQVAAAGGRAHAVVADASDEPTVEALVASCVRDFGGLEVFFANAGIAGDFLPLDELSAAHWRRVLDVNLIGPFLAVKYGARAMKKGGGGSVICTASVAGLRSGAGPTPYSASKAGVVNLVQTAANQLAGTGVRVNAICPGLIETGMTQPIFELARAAGKTHKLGQLNPLRRAGAPAEIASVAAFLASDDASYLNGQAIAVDGGLSSTHPFVPGHLA